MNSSKVGERRRGSTAAGMTVLLLMSGSLSAQWLKIPLPATPRTPDGKPDLTAPAPRSAEGRPDLSGIWQRPRDEVARYVAAETTRRRQAAAASTPSRGVASGGDVLFQPWAEALFNMRVENNGKGAPSEGCLPHGLMRAVSVPEPFKIVQTPALILILQEEFNHYRQIFTDGRKVPEMRHPTWLGYSLGRWDGETLVVDTAGFVDDTWVDLFGRPATTALHVVERFRRKDFGHMEIQFTIDDAKAYVRPWTVTMTFDLLPDTELIEHICENEKDATHLVGK